MEAGTDAKTHGAIVGHVFGGAELSHGAWGAAAPGFTGASPAPLPAVVAMSIPAMSIPAMASALAPLIAADDMFISAGDMSIAADDMFIAADDMSIAPGRGQPGPPLASDSWREAKLTTSVMRRAKRTMTKGSQPPGCSKPLEADAC
ncbi:hypothetical protein [Gemmatimonas sp.]|uniref:hypothetical protein n=1 Tax=Gemmatimonas sp. TaxID=1962908 RepID=UPI003983A60F